MRLVLGACGLVIMLGACVPASRQATGRLTVYSAGPRGVAEAICESFSEATGIPVDLYQATTGQIMARLEAEKYRTRADVVIFASEVAAEALKRDRRLLAFRPRDADRLQPKWSDTDGYYWGSAATLVGIALRAEVAEEAPATWQALFRHPNPRALVMPSPSRAGTTADFVVGHALDNPDETLAAFRDLRAGGMEFAAANSQAIGSLLMGAFDCMIGAADYLIYRQIERGEELVMHYPSDGAYLVIRPIAILSSTLQPDAARQFVDFYLDGPAQQVLVDAHLLSARLDVPPNAIRGSGTPHIIRVDPAIAVQRQAWLLRRFQLEVERAVIPRVDSGRRGGE